MTSWNCIKYQIQKLSDVVPNKCPPMWPFTNTLYTPIHRCVKLCVHERRYGWTTCSPTANVLNSSERLLFEICFCSMRHNRVSRTPRAEKALVRFVDERRRAPLAVTLKISGVKRASKKLFSKWLTRSLYLWSSFFFFSFNRGGCFCRL